MKLYQTFGVTLASDRPFVTPLQRGRRPAELTIEEGTIPPVQPGDLVYPDEVSAWVDVYRSGRRYVVRMGGEADFDVGNRRIGYRMIDPELVDELEAGLFGFVFSLWLETAGAVTLHASAVTHQDRAIGFLSPNTGGKTSLAAALMLRGARLLTDDLLAVDVNGTEVVARPGYPQMRMTRDQVERFWSPPGPLPSVREGHHKLRVPVGSEGFGSFETKRVRLSHLYVLRRDASGSLGTRTEIEELEPVAGFTALAQESWMPMAARHNLGYGPRAAETLAALLDRVRMKSVSYGSGPGHLTTTAEAILEDSLRR